MKITAYHQHHLGSFSPASVCFVTTNLLVVIEPTSLCNQDAIKRMRIRLMNPHAQSKDPATINGSAAASRRSHDAGAFASNARVEFPDAFGWCRPPRDPSTPHRLHLVKPTLRSG
jgi:hypothetical protein